MPDSFTITTTDGERTLTPVPVISMRIDSAIRRLSMLHENQCADEIAKLKTAYPNDADSMAGMHFVNWICDDETILNDFLKMVYTGNHEGINYFDVDRKYIRQLVAFFLIYSFATDDTKMGDTSKSLQSTGAKSPKTKPKSRAGQTHSTTKNGRGKSRKR